MDTQSRIRSIGRRLKERRRGPLGHGGAFGGIATLSPVADGHDPFPACDVCGRTILKGEQIHEYLTPQRQRIRVCVLCRSRAESSGWTPVSMAHTLEDEQPRRSRGQALRQRFGRAASRARSAARSRREPATEREYTGEHEAGQADFERAWAEPTATPEPPPPEAESVKAAD